MSQPDLPPARRPVSSLRAEAAWRATAAGAGGAMGRRNALSGAAGTAAFALVMGLSRPADGPARRVQRPAGPVRRHLSLVVANTGEIFSDVFAEGDQYDAHKLARLNKLLRDPWNGESRAIDPALLDVLSRVQAQVGQTLRVLSAYRSYRTNRFLRIVGYDVAEHSQHVAGKAVDFAVAGIPAPRLGELARQCGAGGIGIYRSGFVHVDTGPARNWTGN